MRLRLTIVTMLAAGIVLSSTGTGLALQAIGQSDDNAGEAQYGAGNQPERFAEEGVGGVQGQAERRPPPANARNQPERELGVAPPINLQPARQVEAGSSLPFTGLAAIPILLLGAALLATGLILHRNARRGG